MTTFQDPRGTEVTVRKIGNSLGVIVPREMLRSLGITEEGQKLLLTETPQGLTLSHEDPTFAKKLDALRNTLARYQNALRELAK